MAFGKQFAKVIEWEEYGEDIIFWKWGDKEIKKKSRLVIHPGQDAIFLYNGKIEGVFEDEGSFEVNSDIIPFLSSLKGFKFGFNSGLRAEVLFINTKEFTVKWGTKNAINIQAPGLKGGMPIRSFGTFNFKVADYQTLIDKVAGIQKQFEVKDVRDRVTATLDQLLMKWIVKEGKDLFHLQLNADAIAKGICEDLDYEMRKIGIAITNFVISSFTYPENVQELAEKIAGQSLIGDMDNFQKASLGQALMNDNSSAGTAAAAMAGMGAASAMAQNLNRQVPSYDKAGGVYERPKFCPNCGEPTNYGDNFCTNCGEKFV